MTSHVAFGSEDSGIRRLDANVRQLIISRAFFRELARKTGVAPRGEPFSPGASSPVTDASYASAEAVLRAQLASEGRPVTARLYVVQIDRATGSGATFGGTTYVLQGGADGDLGLRAGPFASTSRYVREGRYTLSRTQVERTFVMREAATPGLLIDDGAVARPHAQSMREWDEFAQAINGSGTFDYVVVRY